MKWQPPKRIAGNRTAIKSTCGLYTITRDDGESKKGRYKLLRRTGSILRNEGRFNTAEEAKKEIEKWL